jgi:type IV pilus assembly protein PilM
MLSVGIDISSNKITVVELLSVRKRTMIKNAASFEISAESIQKGELQDPVALSKGLREAWKKYRISGRSVLIGLSNLKAIIKEVELPLVSDDEISNSLKYQINDFIPIPKDNILYDYYILDKTESSSRIMLVGAMKSMILNVIEAVRGAGLIASAIDLNCFSLFRTIEYLYDLSSNKKAFCAVNLGPEISIIEIIKNDTLKFPRLLSNSASTFVSNIERMTGIDKIISREVLYNFDFKDLFEKDDTGEKIKSESKASQDKDDKKGADKKDKPDKRKTRQEKSSIEPYEVL